MGKAEERREPSFPLSYWNDAGDTALGPMPDRLKRPEQFREEQAGKDVTAMAKSAVDQVVPHKPGPEAPKNQQVKTRATQEAAPPQPEVPAKEAQALTLGQELQAKYPEGVTLRTDLEFEEFAYYVDYVRQVRELRNRAADNRPGKR